MDLANRILKMFCEDDNYKIMVVANKFQTGFDQPKLAAMFLDKSVRMLMQYRQYQG
jgi:type I restriction enzyme R subunit